ncbi:DNA-processing protein DprA [Tenacibaculum maritimum]|uniref:DNA-processing protein DprA n=1 Tax=Tenacibaculum maritimum TaxID=107401 RepID=UPI003875F57D|nr:DNA-processing protein DprA [Tenacibaculum maritimum]
MKSEKLLAILRLQATKSIGDIVAKKLIKTIGSAEQIFKEKPHTLQKINGIGSCITKQLFNLKNKKKAAKECDYILKNNVPFSYFLSDTYPKYLKHCIDAPILIFKDGNLNLKNDKIIAIVGTRNITSYGRDFCHQLIDGLKNYNPIIVSGFAYGIDICAHKTAINNKLQTVAILAHGLNQTYPKSHKEYIHQLNEKGGFITEFWHNETPFRESFLKRNRIIAGISKATIVIESAERGGSLVTADIANSYNRDVFALPGRNTDIYSKGCNNLIKNNQAHLLTSSEDIAKMLNWDLPNNKPSIQTKLFTELNEDEEKIYNYLCSNGKQLLDTIALHCNIPTYKLSSVLLQMELKKLIKPLPGKLFETI